MPDEAVHLGQRDPGLGARAVTARRTGTARPPRRPRRTARSWCPPPSQVAPSGYGVPGQSRISGSRPAARRGPRSMIAVRSSPAGSVPNGAPGPPGACGPSRDAQNASATGGGRVPHQQRRREGHRDLAGQPPGLVLRLQAGRRLQRGHQRPQAGHGAVQRRVRARRGAQFGQQGVGRALGPGQRPQHVQRGHVARALPDRVQRGLPVDPRQAGLLHVAVAAEAFQRLGGVRREPLAHPVLGRGQRQPQQRGLAGVAARRPGPPRRPAGRRAPSPPGIPAPGRRGRRSSAAGPRVLCRTPAGGWRDAPPRPWRPGCPLRCRCTQSSLVALTIAMIVATPRPGSPTCQASAPSNSTSAEALDRLPSLSLSRCRRIPLRVPSGSTRGSRKQVSPAGPWASVRNRSDMGAEQNHLCPVSRCAPSPAPGRARRGWCSPARRSRPASRSWPCRTAGRACPRAGAARGRRRGR